MRPNLKLFMKTLLNLHLHPQSLINLHSPEEQEDFVHY